MDNGKRMYECANPRCDVRFSKWPSQRQFKTAFCSRACSDTMVKRPSIWDMDSGVCPWGHPLEDCYREYKQSNGFKKRVCKYKNRERDRSYKSKPPEEAKGQSILERMMSIR